MINNFSGKNSWIVLQKKNCKEEIEMDITYGTCPNKAAFDCDADENAKRKLWPTPDRPLAGPSGGPIC